MLFLKLVSAGLCLLTGLEPAGDRLELAESFEPPQRAVFRIWGAHGDLAPTGDGKRLFVVENGPEVLALRVLSLADGSARIVAKDVPDAVHMVVLPGTTDRMAMAWPIGVGTAPPYGVGLFDVASKALVELDAGSVGSDGQLRVSASGLYLATGISLTASDWGPRRATEVAVYSCKSGKKEYVVKTGRPAGNDQVVVDKAVERAENARFGWTDDDVLTILQGGTWVAHQRSESGGWNEASRPGVVLPESRSQQRLTPGELLRLTAGDARTVAVRPSTLFENRKGRISAASLADGSLVYRILSGRDGYDEVEVVLLKWRTEGSVGDQAR